MLISPTRLTFSETPGQGEVTLRTTGAPQTYDVLLVDRVMTPDGRILEATDPALGPLAGPFRASARQVLSTALTTVAVSPEAGSRVRVSYAGAGGLAPGEYRTHLTFRAQPTAAAEASAPRVVFAYAIPLIVRIGAVDARAAIEAVRLRRLSSPGAAPNAVLQTTPALGVELVRLGSSSVFGDVEVQSLRDPAGPLLAELRGVAVYPEVARRTLVLPLTRELGPGERVRIRYIDRDVKPGRLLADVELAPGGVQHARSDRTAP
ncbi:hypothetical protein DJ018_15385 [Phenylobacterium deserti]|uniref:Molecular chaperone n=1 Tax=Phenylobacterium deserti TaxID=1914756 RepID=A0A328AD49_9CAUL|nr:hypothetical protein DJ018_15385 [Phenylobacterium deserti]